MSQYNSSRRKSLRREQLCFLSQPVEPVNLQVESTNSSPGEITRGTTKEGRGIEKGLRLKARSRSVSSKKYLLKDA